MNNINVTTRKSIKRNVGLDILRIISMLMVVVLHYLNKKLGGVLAFASEEVYYVAWIIESLCYCAVNLFVLTSGFFLCDREKVNYKKIIILILEVLFYSVGLYFLGCAFGITDFYFPTLFTDYLFPTISGTWWFVTDYVILYLLAPYINRGLKTLSKKQHLNLTVMLLAIFSVIPTIFFFRDDVIGLENGYSLIWLIVLYVVAAYIKRSDFKVNRIVWLGGYIGFSAVTALCKFLQGFIIEKEYFNLYSYTSITVLGAAVCLFCFFKEIDSHAVRIGKVMRKVGELSFAVFLIHTHGIWTDWLWNICVRATEYMQSVPEMILHLAISVAGIYSICSAIDYLRKLLFDGIEHILQKLRMRGKKDIH